MTGEFDVYSARKTEIDVKLQEVYQKLNEAMVLACKYNIGFNFQPCYGMGGYFYPPGESYGDGCENLEEFWSPSSQSC